MKLLLIRSPQLLFPQLSSGCETQSSEHEGYPKNEFQFVSLRRGLHE